ncbi:MAG: hypothetical protein K2M60_12100 [Lachnospiraceae bacterium]|nr:hypothetical protein [Lachnospiraceae bacterium]MDE6253672.1 hypothetical protein [Lachnospiraceae bacterium]
MNNDAVLTVIQETVILVKRIQMYGSVESPLFLQKDVVEWIYYQFVSGKKVRNTSKMLKLVDNDEKVKATWNIPTKDTPNKHSGLRKTQAYGFSLKTYSTKFVYNLVNLLQNK